MLDMTGYKSKEEDALRAELIARKILAEELKGNYDIGALIGADEQGNLWIFSSEEAKDAANRRNGVPVDPAASLSDAASDPGYQSDEERAAGAVDEAAKSGAPERPAMGLVTPPQTPPDAAAGDPNVNYAKTIRLTSAQLQALNLQPGPNRMSFTVNRATCRAHMHYWPHSVPVVISDIDGTITKSDALGHMFGMIGRDWTHPGVAKLYTDIAANGYNIVYLTSRSIGQADSTRAYLDGISQDGHTLPKGAVVLSPDRTFTALRRELYIRKPEVFKMRALREILDLYGPAPAPGGAGPFHAGFGNRLTDALSYRAVHVPPTRIFTINAQGEVALDLLTMGAYRSSYVSMREVVDHFFPPVGLLVRSGGEEYTDFSYWRAAPLPVEAFTDSESEGEGGPVRGRGRAGERAASGRSEDERGEDDDDEEPLEESVFSGEDDRLGESILSGEDDRLEESVRSGDLTDSVLESVEDESVLSRVASLDLEPAAGPAPRASDVAQREPVEEAEGEQTPLVEKTVGLEGALQSRPYSNPL